MAAGITQNQLADEAVIIRKRSVTLTNAQILGLKSNSVMIIPAPAANEIIDVHHGRFSAHIEADGGYSGIDATGSYLFMNYPPDGLEIMYAHNDTYFGLDFVSRLLAFPGDATFSWIPSLDVGNPDMASQSINVEGVNYFAGREVHLRLSNSVQLTGGHADNKLICTILYSVNQVVF